MAALEELIETAIDSGGSSFGRRMAVADLGKSDDNRAFETLATLLDDEDQYLRREVVTALTRKGDHRTVEPLIQALDDTDDYIQRDAAVALGRLGDVRAVDPLGTLLDHDSYSVRDAAKRALEAIEREPRTLAQSPPPPAAETEVEPPAAEEKIVDTEDEKEQTPTVAVETAPEELHEEPDQIEAVDEAFLPDVDEETSDEIDTDDIDSISMAEGLESLPPLDVEPVSSPWEPVTDIAAAGPSGIVTAEIVVEPTSPAPGDVEPLPPDAFLLGIPRAFSWETARRMRVFFADQLADVQQAYERLHEQQKKLLVAERKHHQTVQQLGFRRADKDDDLGQCEDDIDAAKEELRRLEQSAARARRDLNRVKTEANSMGHQLVTSIWPDKGKKNQQMRSQIEAALRQLEHRITTIRGRISELNEKHGELAEPRKRLQAAAERLAADKDSSGDVMREASEEISERIMSTIRLLPRDELDSRFKQLGVLSTDGAYFHACVNGFLSALSELGGTLSQLEKADTEVAEAADAAQQTCESLGTAIASGFHTATVEKQTPVRLSGSLHFKQDHSFFGGYSGASGSASGSGSGQASYSIEEVQWRAPTEFQNQVADFAESWGACGERTARREMLSASEIACRRIVAEYIHFIRTELERDFIELHAER